MASTTDDRVAQLEKTVQKLGAEMPSVVTDTEQFIKFGAIIPLMLILSNHLGNYLPLPLTSETRLSNLKRWASLGLIYLLLVISFMGSIDYTDFGLKDKKLYPLYDTIAALFAMILLLMVLRLTHWWMYMVVIVIFVVMLGLYYSVKWDVQTKIDRDPLYSMKHAEEPSKKIIAARWLGITLPCVIFIFYYLSWCFVNEHFADFYTTSSVVHFSSGNYIQNYEVNYDKRVGFMEFGLHPRPVTDADAFTTITSKQRFPSRLYNPFGGLFVGKDKKVQQRQNELVTQIVNSESISDAAKRENLLFLANTDHVESIGPLRQGYAATNDGKSNNMPKVVPDKVVTSLDNASLLGNAF